MEALVHIAEGDLLHWQTLLGEQQYQFFKNMSFQLQIMWLLTSWISLRQGRGEDGFERKNSKTAAKNTKQPGKQTLKIEWGSSSRKRTASTVPSTKSAKK